MVSEFGATLGCKGCLVIGQPHTEESRARMTTCMENDPEHAKSLEDNLIRRTELANPEPEMLRRVRVEQMRRNMHAETRFRHKNLQTPEPVRAGKRPLEPGGDDDVESGLDVCDELNACPSDAHVNDCEGDYTDEVTGVTLLRDDVAKARAEETAWCEKLEGHVEVTDETCVSRTDAKQFFVDTSTMMKMNVWKYYSDRLHAKLNRKGLTATSQEHHRCFSNVS